LLRQVGRHRPIVYCDRRLLGAERIRRDWLLRRRGQGRRREQLINQNPHLVPIRHFHHPALWRGDGRRHGAVNNAAAQIGGIDLARRIRQRNDLREREICLDRRPQELQNNGDAGQRNIQTEDLVKGRTYHLLLALHARKVTGPMACAGILQRHLAIHMLQPCGDIELHGAIVRRGIFGIVDILGHLDIQPPDGIHQLLKASKVDADIVVDRHAERVPNGLFR